MSGGSAVNQRSSGRSPTRHFDHPAYRAYVAGPAICIVCIVAAGKPLSANAAVIPGNITQMKAKITHGIHGFFMQTGWPRQYADRLTKLTGPTDPPLQNMPEA